MTRTYGSSETSGGCVYDGSPLSDVQVAITDGQVELGGSVIAEGYLDDQERTDAAFFARDGTAGTAPATPARSSTGCCG